MFLVAGEASGDLHGANLVKSIQALRPDAVFEGVGGERMAGAGVRILVPASELAVVGITEVVPRAAVVLRAARRVKRHLREHPPSLLVLIDFPDFNLHLAAAARRRKIPVLYYISPQVWAWRTGRVRKIRRRVDRMAVILPFEQAFYEAHGVRVDYVGHPLLDSCPVGLSREKARALLGVADGVPVLTLLPGSRKEEVGRLLPVMLEAYGMVREKVPEVQAFLALADTLERKFVEGIASCRELPLRVLCGKTYELLAACDAALLASGTAALEAAIMGAPMVVAYRTSPLTYWLGKKLAKVHFISLVNLVAGRQVVPELIQDAVTPANLAQEALTLLGGQESGRRMRRDLEEIRHQLGSGGASRRTAEIALQMIDKSVIEAPEGAVTG